MQIKCYINIIFVVVVVADFFCKSTQRNKTKTNQKISYIHYIDIYIYIIYIIIQCYNNHSFIFMFLRFLNFYTLMSTHFSFDWIWIVYTLYCIFLVCGILIFCWHTYMYMYMYVYHLTPLHFSLFHTSGPIVFNQSINPTLFVYSFIGSFIGSTILFMFLCFYVFII